MNRVFFFFFMCLHFTCKEFETEKDEAGCIQAPSWLLGEREGDPGFMSFSSCRDSVVQSHRLLFHMVDCDPERVSCGKSLWSAPDSLFGLLTQRFIPYPLQKHSTWAVLVFWLRVKENACGFVLVLPFLDQWIWKPSKCESVSHSVISNSLLPHGL